jgi:hypothetical protein
MTAWIVSLRARAITAVGEKHSPLAPNLAMMAKVASCAAFALTFRGRALWSAQPSGSLSANMRNIITKLLILVVPRRTAGDG